MPDVEPFTHWRLKKPDWQATIGQSQPPSGMVIEKDGRRYEIPWGTEVRASRRCDPDGGVGSLDREPPLLRCAFIEAHRNQFEYLGSSD